MDYDGQLHSTPDSVLEAFRTRIRAASEEVVLSLPVEFLPALESALRGAIDRDLFVMLLVHSYTGASDPDPVPFEDIATVARRTDGTGRVICITDKEWGIDGQRLRFPDDGPEIDDEYRFGTTICNPLFAQALYGYLVADDWVVADEAYVSPKPALPTTYANFRRAVIEATLFLRDGELLEVSATLSEIGGEATHEVEGTAVNARQTVVHPISSTFPSEHSLFLHVDGERVSVGGRGSFLEDFECVEITFERVRDGEEP